MSSVEHGSRARYVEMVRMCLAEVGYPPELATEGRPDLDLADDVQVWVDGSIPSEVAWRAAALVAHRMSGVKVACLACFRRWPRETLRRRAVCTADRPGVLDCGADRG